MAASMSISAFKQIWKMLPSGKNFDRVFNKINMVAVSPGRCRCEMTVEEEHTNGQGTLHGGFTMSLLDYMTFFTVVTGTSGQMGVSVRANMNFLQSAKVGEKVAMEAELVKAGKTLAFTKADLFNAKGDVIAQGQQTIYIGNNVTIQDMIKSKMEQL
ncbi:acyl-coenzyme A thioesterase 13-like [Acanthaster planci]|uniref:Acyl-coenzyme A thioesterase 13 n=1 Tax=Acanthaster planci TaxID=133434 RepID=A0A8B7YAM4_ACAPL|nr:acyl-coenzyme A thioesterase 13-like [Acanthaster planci]